MSDSDSEVTYVGETQQAQDWAQFWEDADRHDEHRKQRQEAGYESNSDQEGNQSTRDAIQRPGDGQSIRHSGTERSTDGRRERSPIRTTILGNKFIDHLLQRYSGHPSYRLVRDVFQFRGHKDSYQQVRDIHRSLQEKHTFHAIVQHDHEGYDHYHVIHVCPWKRNQCRCFFVPSRRKTRTVYVGKIEREDWNNFFQYYTKDARLLQYLYSGDIGHRALRGIEFISSKGLEDGSKEREVEASGSKSKDACDGCRIFDTGITNKQVVRPTEKQQYIVRNPKPEEVEQLMMSHITVPIHSICTTTIWNKSKFRYVSPKDQIITQIIDSLRSQFVHWKLKDYMLYLETNTPLYECLNGDIESYYYDEWESIEIISKLLTFQLEDIALGEEVTVDKMITTFLQEVHDICEKKIPKKNTLEITGPASCGKSYFCDMVCNFYINVGHVRNFSKLDSFPLQSAYNRRILLWNECQFEHSAQDTVKLLLGGDPCPANIKYEDIKTIARTPVIITANTRWVPNTAPFNDRMIRYTWKPCISLKNNSRKPNPKCLPALFDYHNVNIK